MLQPTMNTPQGVPEKSIEKPVSVSQETLRRLSELATAFEQLEGRLADINDRAFGPQPREAIGDSGGSSGMVYAINEQIGRAESCLYRMESEISKIEGVF